MATAGDGTPPYETGGAGGKFRKKPLRRSIPATPYSRPPTAIRNNKPNMLKKLMEPASRLIYAGAHKLFDVFRKSLPPRSLGLPEINEQPQNVIQNEGGNGDSASFSVTTGISELELLLQQKTFTRSEVQRLTSLLHSQTTESPSDDSLEKHGDKRDNFYAAISTPIVTSGVLKEETASPAELAKYYMGSRPTGQAPRQDSMLLPRTSINSVDQKTANSSRNLENGFVTPRSRGRSAMYTMARRPYSGSPSTFSQQGIKSDDVHDVALTSFQGHEGKLALKRRSSVLDEDIGSGGPLRRIRQKANLLSQRERKELGYTAFQQADGVVQNLLLTDEPEPKVSNYASVPTKATQTANKIFQHLDKPSSIENNSVSTLAGMKEKSPNKLRLDMLHGQALKSLEKVDSPKFLPSSHDIQKPVVSELTLQSKDKIEENGLRKFPIPNDMLTSVNGDMTDTLKKDKAPVGEIADLPSKVTEEPQRKHAFQMSAPEYFFEIDDDDNDDIHDNGHVPLPLVENNKPDLSAADIIKTPTLLEVSKTPELVKYNKPVFHEASKAPKQVELKEAENDICTPKTDFGFLGGSVSEQGSGFNNSILSPSSPSVTTVQTSVFTKSTSQMENAAPVKVSPLPFSTKLSESKPNAGSDPKEIVPISVFNSVTKNDHVKDSVLNKDENRNDQKSTNMFGKSEPLSPAVSAATSTDGIFSFGTSNKNLSTHSTTLASNSPNFPSLAPSPSEGTAAITTTIAAATSTTTTTTATMAALSTTTTITTTPAAIFSTVSPQVFSFGLATSAPSTSVAETGNTGTSSSSPFAITTFATTTTTESGLFGFSSPAAATSTTTGSTTVTRNGLFGFSSPAAATSTITGTGLSGFSSTAAITTTTTVGGSGLFGVSSSAAAVTSATTTTTTTTTGNGLFGFSSPAANSTPTGSGLFGFSSPAATTTTTTGGSGLFGFSSPTEASSTAVATTTSGSGLFGVSSSAAATSTATATGSGLFGVSSAAAAATSTATTTGGGLFSFSSPAAATSTSNTGSGLFSFGSSVAAPSTTSSQSHGSFFNITNGFQSSTNASSTSTLFGSSAPAFGSTSSFGISSMGPTSANSTSGSTTSIFGSSWQPQNSSGFGSTFTSSAPSSVFSFGASSTPTSSFATAGASNPPFGGPAVFGNSTPVFGAVATSPNNGDQMSMEDSMAEDSMQTHSPVSPFGQAPVSAPGFMFGSTPTPNPAPISFSFGGQQNQALSPQNPFQSSSLEFNAGGGSFSLGSGGDKSNRRIVRPMKSKNRKK